MSDKPLVFSLLIGLIVVLVVAGVSLSVQINRQSEVYKKEVAKSISLQKDIENIKAASGDTSRQMEALRSENDSLKSTIAKLTSDLEILKIEKDRLERLKAKVEQNLADELIKQEPDTANAPEQQAGKEAAKETPKETKAESKAAPKGK